MLRIIRKDLIPAFQPWLVERHSYLPDPSLPRSRKRLHVRLYREGSGNQNSSQATSYSCTCSDWLIIFRVTISTSVLWTTATNQRKVRGSVTAVEAFMLNRLDL